jgi:ubiquinone/menaquinone biosynthesis C-methylase UbiE
MTRRDPWDDAGTARRYEWFCARHRRYADANAALVRAARVRGGQSVLDVASGTGRTAEAVLTHLGRDGRVVCVERSDAMRSLGARRVRDARVTWRADLPRAGRVFDRVLCGAAIWQMAPLDRALERLARRVAPEGALCFDVPSAYLGVADAPGGGADPWLTGLCAALAAGRELPRPRPWAPADPDRIDATLRACGLEPRRTEFRRRLTQREFRDWLRLPVLTDRLLAGLGPRERDRAIDRAWRSADPASWRWEAWTIWAAWRKP